MLPRIYDKTKDQEFKTDPHFQGEPLSPAHIQPYPLPLPHFLTDGAVRSSNNNFQSSVFVLTQLHFGQWSSLPFCLPSLIVRWPARIFTFSYCAWTWNWLISTCNLMCKSRKIAHFKCLHLRGKSRKAQEDWYWVPYPLRTGRLGGSRVNLTSFV